MAINRRNITRPAVVQLLLVVLILNSEFFLIDGRSGSTLAVNYLLLTSCALSLKLTSAGRDMSPVLLLLFFC